MAKINTNMASEFWFFSQLHRLGYKAYITLGNTKAIDMTVHLSNEQTLTFDVKGKETFNSGTYMYLQKTKSNNHYFAFVGLQIKKTVDKVLFVGEPECYIIPSIYLNTFAFDWTSSKNTTGYGFDQNILRIIKKYSNETDNLTKTERNKLNAFKNHKGLRTLNFTDLKQKILTLSDFENKFHLVK